MPLPKQPLREASTLAVTAAPVWESREGCIAGIDAEGRPLVDFEGNPAGPSVALSTVPLRSAVLDEALLVRQRVKLRFHDGDVRRPVIVGLSQDEQGKTATRRPFDPPAPGLELVKGGTVDIG